MTPLVVFGTGGMGREILSIIDAISRTGDQRWSFVGFVADWPEDEAALQRLGSRFLGAPEQAVSEGLVSPGTAFSVGIGDSTARQAVHQRLESLGLIPATLVHPSATVGPDVRLGPGTVICAGAHLTTSITAGTGVIINVCATASHDTHLGEFVTLSPHASLLGRARVGARSTLHTNSTVLPRVVVGRDCVVGAGAVVLHDVPDDTTVYGVPARPSSTGRVDLPARDQAGASGTE